jgi:hypothetical protein
LNDISLEQVTYIPRELRQGVLYVSKEYGVAAHLCMCGCGNKVVTPLGPAEWKFAEEDELPSLFPSIGNWQMPCKSHYVITNGNVIWAKSWNEAQIQLGRYNEEKARVRYYGHLQHEGSWLKRVWNFAKSKLFGA